MFKTIFTLYSILLYSLHSAQIGIGTETVSPSEALKIESRLATDPTGKYRGLLIPRILLTDPASSIAPFTVVPKGGLLLFNTEPSKEGFYYFTGKQNGSTVMWEPVFSEIILKDKVVPLKSVNAQSAAGAFQTSGTGGTSPPYTIGESASIRPWVKIPGMSKVVRLTSPTNNVTVLAEGLIQLNNDASTGGSYVEAQSFAVGIFVNGSLASVRTYVVDGFKSNTCLTHIFNIKMNLENLPVNSNQNIEIFSITRTKVSGDATSVAWAAPHNNCSSFVNSFMAKASLSLQIQNF